jgi:hypothetical protein
MKIVVNICALSERRMAPQVQLDPTLCEHQYEVIAHEEGGSLRGCARCGSLER